MRLMKSLDEDTGLEIRYEKAIKSLLDLALDQSCCQARIAADVLMSAADMDRTPHRKWTVNLSELRFLHAPHTHAAVGVIHGRTSLRTNPQIAIENGQELFQRVWKRWRNIEEW